MKILHFLLLICLLFNMITSFNRAGKQWCETLSMVGKWGTVSFFFFKISCPVQFNSCSALFCSVLFLFYPNEHISISRHAHDLLQGIILYCIVLFYVLFDIKSIWFIHVILPVSRWEFSQHTQCPSFSVDSAKGPRPISTLRHAFPSPTPLFPLYLALTGFLPY